MSTTDTDTRQRQWAATSFFRRWKAQFKDGWHDLPEGAAKRWLISVGIGFVLCIGLTVGMSLLVEATTSGASYGWEPGFLRWIKGVVPVTWAQWASILGNSIFLWPMTVLAAGMAAWYKRPLRALSIFPGYPLTQLIVTAGWIAWGRSEPKRFNPTAASEAYSSFPSGHVAHAVFAFGILAYLWWISTRRPGERVAVLVAFLVATGAVSIGRVATAAHWPTDIIGAWVCGLSWLAVHVIALRVSGTTSAEGG